MKWMRDLTLPLLLLYCCDLPTPGGPSSWISGIQADDSPNEVTYNVKVDLSASVHEIGGRFLSMSFPAKYIPVQWYVQYCWTEKLQNLASALSPADIRVLGKFQHFCPDQNVEPSKIQGRSPNAGAPQDPCKNKEVGSDFVLRGNQWQIFNANVAKVGWSLLLGFENTKRKADGSWDSSLAELLLNYSSSKDIPIGYFHLGNEPNLYPVHIRLTITPKTLVEDYKTLRRLVAKYSLYAASKLYGPDVTTLDKHSTARNYLTHYYCKNNASMEEFLNLSSLESLRSSIEIGKTLVQVTTNPLPLILSETSSCAGGGAPNLSGRYLAGFLWLDKLGLSAVYGVKQVFRQSFFSGAAYSLVLISDTTPQPDYYLSVLYKRLVEGPVFRVNLNPSNQKLRVYANCAKQGKYTPGDLVIYYLNLEEIPAILSLDQFQDADLDLYMLTPGDSEGIKSREVKLRGNPRVAAQSFFFPLFFPGFF
ncbi:unnamed protein product [Candidula unifasciata]|uniref:Heparanase n=1 Tax=Candidula unifasciata TaxID=100452 RepID=A0A8S3ZAL5_9EUPU|nr:unnamed protein product [Candidula unifasciata]